MRGYLAKIAGMASSSKRRRPASSKQTSEGKARVISTRRTDALPRKGNVSTGRRKPVVQPPIDAPLAPLATAVAGAHSLQETETSASRKKTTRAAGRAPGKLKKPAATKPVVEALAFVETDVEVEAEVEVEVEASAIVEETTIVEAPCALPVEAVTRTALPSPAPTAALAPRRGKRALVTVVTQLFSALRRWTGVR